MKERQENLSSAKPAKSVELGDGMPTVHNITNDASLVQEIMEETHNRFEKLISGLGNTFAPASSAQAESGLKA